MIREGTKTARVVDLAREGLSHKEISREVGISEKAVAAALSYARARNVGGLPDTAPRAKRVAGSRCISVSVNSVAASRLAKRVSASGVPISEIVRDLVHGYLSSEVFVPPFLPVAPGQASKMFVTLSGSDMEAIKARYMLRSGDPFWHARASVVSGTVRALIEMAFGRGGDE